MYLKIHIMVMINMHNIVSKSFLSPFALYSVVTLKYCTVYICLFKIYKF